MDFPNTVRQLLVDVRKEAGEAKSYQIQLHGKELSSELEVPRSPRGSTDLLNRVQAQFGAAKGGLSLQDWAGKGDAVWAG